MNKNHHIIPRTILRQFSHNGKRLTLRNYGVKVVDSKVDISIFTTVKLKNISDEEYEKLDHYYQIAEKAFGLTIEPIKRHIKEGHNSLNVSEVLTKNNLTIDPKFEQAFDEFYRGRTLKEEKFIPVNMNRKAYGVTIVSGGIRPELFKFIISALLARFNYLDSNYLNKQNIKFEYSNWENIYSQINVFELIVTKTPVEVPITGLFWIIPFETRMDEFKVRYDKYIFPITPNLCVVFEHNHSTTIPMSITYNPFTPIKITRVEELRIAPFVKQNNTFLIKNNM